MQRFANLALLAALASASGDHGADGHSHEEPDLPDPVFKQVDYSSLTLRQTGTGSAADPAVFSLVTPQLVTDGKAVAVDGAGSWDPATLTLSLDYDAKDSTNARLATGTLSLVTPESHYAALTDAANVGKEVYFAFFWSIWDDATPADGVKVVTKLAALDGDGVMSGELSVGDAHIDNGMDSSHLDETANLTVTGSTKKCDASTKLCTFSATFTRKFETGNFDDVQFLADGTLLRVMMKGEYQLQAEGDDQGGAYVGEPFTAVVGDVLPADTAATKVSTAQGDFTEGDNAVKTALSLGLVAATTMFSLL